MTDSVLIQDGIAWQIWPGVAKADLPPMHTDLVVVEVTSGTVQEGYLWDGTAFSVPPVPVPPTVISYTEFRARWSDAQKAALHAARAASWQIDDFIGLAQAQNSVNLDPVVAGPAKTAIVAAGVLTQADADTIFTP